MLHNRYLIPGGEDQSSAAEAALLARHGYQVELLEEDNRRVEELGKARTALRTLWSSESLKRVETKLREERFDLLHVQNFFPLWSPSVYYAAAHAGVPVVQTLRNYRLICTNAIFFRENHVCEDCIRSFMPWRGIVHACYRESRAASSVVAGMVGWHKLIRTWQKRIHVYIALTDFAREKYVAAGLPAERIVVKPNFIDPSPAPGRGGGGYALYVGRLSAEKGIATMLEAWKSAQDPMPLKIVGQGPLTGLVQDVARASERIEHLGSKSLPEVLKLMGNAEFLVFPSEWYETMGRTIMEAFAVGTPVLVSKLGPMATMVTPNQTGFHFVPGNISELRERVEWCSRNLGEVRALRTNARAAFEASYTGNANLERLLAIYAIAQKNYKS